MKRYLLIILLVIVVVLAIIFWPSQAAPTTNVALESLLVASEDQPSEFARALIPGDVIFPRDLGAHDDFETEWWYYTGNLETEDGRPFGFQFTIFRRALTPEELDSHAPDASAWRDNQVYMAHFTVSDIVEDEFYSAERFSRGAADLAGAVAVPYRVWLEDWQVAEIAPGQVRLQAAAEDFAIDLLLTETLPPVLHGDGGLSQKGPEPGNASYYYSIVRQETDGTINIEGQQYPVRGLSWKDHEYSTSALSPGSIGWDWFSLQLDDGSAITLFQIRREDGSLEPFSNGSYIHPDGSVENLGLDDWQLETEATWTSPDSGAVYPSAWRLTIPGKDLLLEGVSLMGDQELNLTTTYWEGAVSFSGTRSGEAVEAQGYVEMTGYAPGFAAQPGA